MLNPIFATSFLTQITSLTSTWAPTLANLNRPLNTTPFARSPVMTTLTQRPRAEDDNVRPVKKSFRRVAVLRDGEGDEISAWVLRTSRGASLAAPQRRETFFPRMPFLRISSALSSSFHAHHLREDDGRWLHEPDTPIPPSSLWSFEAADVATDSHAFRQWLRHCEHERSQNRALHYYD